ncbi:MAG: MarR family transcriptional regulator [Pseudomonadota bacterium]
MSRDAKSFDLPDFLPYLLNQAAEAASLEFQKIYKGRYGMLRTDWRVLFHLGVYGPLTAKDIASRAGIHKTKISRAVTRLEKLRFLTRKRDANDRRFETLRLTPSGIAAFRDLRDAAQKYDAALTRDFRKEDTTMLREMLKRVAQS